MEPDDIAAFRKTHLVHRLHVDPRRRASDPAVRTASGEVVNLREALERIQRMSEEERAGLTEPKDEALRQEAVEHFTSECMSAYELGNGLPDLTAEEAAYMIWHIAFTARVQELAHIAKLAGAVMRDMGKTSPYLAQSDIDIANDLSLSMALRAAQENPRLVEIACALAKSGKLGMIAKYSEIVGPTIAESFDSLTAAITERRKTETKRL